MSTPTSTPAAQALDALVRHEAWAAIRLRDSSTVTLVGGTRSEVESLMDVPLEEGPAPSGRRFDRLLAIPFRQVAERGFDVHDDGAPLTVVHLESEVEVPLAEILTALPDEPVDFEDRGGFDSSDDEYGAVVDRIIEEEIGNGEGANLVVGRHYRAQLRDWDARKALTHFVSTSLGRFGGYQDAMKSAEDLLFHAVLSPYLNIGLLTPREVCEAALATPGPTSSTASARSGSARPPGTAHSASASTSPA